MTVIKLALLKHSKAKDGSYKIRIAIGHRSETHYIVTPYSVNSPSEFDGRAVVRLPNAAQMNIELTRMLLDYQQRLSRVRNPEQYTCTQLRTLLMQMQSQQADITFKKASDEFINELKRSQRTTYANMMQKTQEYFLDFCNGDIFLSTLTPQHVLDFSRYLMNRTLKKSTRTFSDTTINIHMTDLIGEESCFKKFLICRRRSHIKGILTAYPRIHPFIPGQQYALYRQAQNGNEKYR